MSEFAIDPSIANQRPHEADKVLDVRFSYQPVQNEEASLKEGRPIYEDKPFITIRIPGDKDNVVFRPYWDDPRNPNSDAVRFGDKFTAWKNKTAAKATGTPLSVLGVSPSQEAELMHFNITTLEQLSDAADVQVQKFMGGHKLKQRAQDYLAAAKGRAPTEQLRAELEKRDAQLATQAQQLKELGESLAALQKKNSKA